MSLITLLILAISTTAPASTAAPSTQVASINPNVSKPMSSDYSLLLSHSMFVRGHVAIDTHRPGGGFTIYRPPTTMPAPSVESSLRRAEKQLVFNGVTVSNGTPMAFIEDTTNQKVLTVGINQSISEGTITGITLNTLTYNNRQGSKVLHIGQDFSGHDANLGAAVPDPTAGGSSSTTAPSDAASSGPPAAPGSAAAILENMRKKRAAELGH